MFGLRTLRPYQLPNVALRAATKNADCVMPVSASTCSTTQLIVGSSATRLQFLGDSIVVHARAAINALHAAQAPDVRDLRNGRHAQSQLVAGERATDQRSHSGATE
jgi:hypothetical protein